MYPTKLWIASRTKRMFEKGEKLMKSTLFSCIVCAGLCAMFLPTVATAGSWDGAVVQVADHLVAVQHSDGTWYREKDFTGSIVAGLVRAYEATGNDAYITAAKRGASYIMSSAGGNFFGDEAHALTRLTETIGDPAYVDAVRDFYNGLDTAQYISGFDGTDRSNAVFYVAHHAVAAHSVGAKDADIWRQALIQYLALIDDDVAYYPVMSLGVATWALAQTGPMDDTKIDPDGAGEDYWVDVKLSDLPDRLATHQVSSGGRTGSFYYRLGHSRGFAAEASGYTEDTVYGLLGLIAADDAGWDFDQEIQNARGVLPIAVSNNNVVQCHIWSWSPLHYTYGGEMLQAAASPGPSLLLQQQQVPLEESRPRPSFRPPLR